MLLAALIESAAATGSSYRRFPHHRPASQKATLFHPLSRRLARVPSAAALRGQAPIVIKKHRSSLSGNTVQPHIGVDGITAPFLHAPRDGGYRATLNGWARLEWGGTHAPTKRRTCSHLRSGRRVRQHNRQRRVDDDHPIDDSASPC